MTFAPDRRPIKRISIYTGEPTHPRGIHKLMWTLDGFRTRLFGELDGCYVKGWRRFMLHAPAGRPHSVAAAGAGYGLYHHHHLPDDVRAMLKRELSAWLKARPDAVVSVYVGFAVSDAGRYHVLPTDQDRRLPDPTNQRDRDAFLLEIEQWLAIAPEPGQIGFGFDASRLAPGYLVGWADELRARGVWCLGEAIPETTPPTAAAPEAVLAPWWASAGFLKAPNRPHRQAWTWDPETTEVAVGFQNGDLTSQADAESWASKGYVLSSWYLAYDDMVLQAGTP